MKILRTFYFRIAPLKDQKWFFITSMSTRYRYLPLDCTRMKLKGNGGFFFLILNNFSLSPPSKRRNEDSWGSFERYVVDANQVEFAESSSPRESDESDWQFWFCLMYLFMFNGTRKSFYLSISPYDNKSHRGNGLARSWEKSPKKLGVASLLYSFFGMYIQLTFVMLNAARVLYCG